MGGSIVLIFSSFFLHAKYKKHLPDSATYSCRNANLMRILCVAEKPSAAKQIASILSQSNYQVVSFGFLLFFCCSSKRVYFFFSRCHFYLYIFFWWRCATCAAFEIKSFKKKNKKGKTKQNNSYD